ncbi:glycosyltransferase [Roseovarius sp.]|uniref:glycosyltransferase n=1 Tax=Roseovarius sp. TaxID=1486281 RepID=UPI003D0CCD5F
MIFLTTGTQLPFDRLVKAVDEWVGRAKLECEVFGQVLSPSQDPYHPQHFEIKERLSPVEYAEVLGKADLIISHAGMGTILTALTEGKQICIMPRRHKYGEHRNDHQIATVERLGDHAGLYKASDEHDLPRCIEVALKAAGRPKSESIDPFASADFTESLRAFILGSHN